MTHKAIVRPHISGAAALVVSLALLLPLASAAQSPVYGRSALNAGLPLIKLPFFLDPVAYDSGGLSAGPVAVADLNGDGKPDLVVSNGSGIGVLMGNGDGTFQPAVDYNSAGSGPSSLAITDVNGDGIPDLLASIALPCGIQPNGCVAVLLGNGDGSFRPAVTFDAGGPYTYSIAVADFNGDGKLDIVVTDCGPITGSGCGLYGVMMGKGDGTFGPVATHSSGGVGAWSVTAGDVNRDGKVDLVIGNLCQNAGCTGDGVVSVLLGRGNGRFSSPVNYPSGGRTFTPVVADVNGDGNPDIVVANAVGKAGVGVLLGQGNGKFLPVVTYATGEKFVSSLKVGDVNGDGRLDVVVADCSSGQYTCQVTGSVSVLLGNGDGTFQPASNSSSGGQVSFNLAISDLNGDGWQDVAVTNCAPENGVCGTQNGVVSVLLNRAGAH